MNEVVSDRPTKVIAALRLNPEITYYNLSVEELEKHSIKKLQAQRSSSGALVIRTGTFTGRSPEDRFIVNDSFTKNKVWWGSINKPFEDQYFQSLKEDMIAYFDTKEIYIRDCFVGAHPDHRMGLTVINEYPWSNHFAYNMFIRPSEKELSVFETEWTILNAPGFEANPEIHQTRSKNFTIINFTEKMILIGGSGYTGEIKKGIFSVLNLTLPVEKNVLSMHCSANVGVCGDTALYFGLSGTGKTTLSAHPQRELIGDDEHGWCEDGTIFNFEGGCYAKVIGLSETKEPEIFNAISRGALLENVVMDITGKVDYFNDRITQNTRVSYPIHHIHNIREGGMANHPKNIFFLTADAYGVLPPISKLNPNQAAYHFISGYTAKVAGTEEGVSEPKAVFSCCFGAPFMPLEPNQYAKMFIDRITSSEVNVWLVNTGWINGAYGKGNRIELKYTRAMIQAVLDGQLNVPFKKHEIFGLMMPTSCPNVPSNLLDPEWEDKTAYDQEAKALIVKFEENMEQFQVSLNVLEGALG